MYFARTVIGQYHKMRQDYPRSNFWALEALAEAEQASLTAGQSIIVPASSELQLTHHLRVSLGWWAQAMRIK